MLDDALVGPDQEAAAGLAWRRAQHALEVDMLIAIGAVSPDGAEQATGSARRTAPIREDPLVTVLR